MHVVNQVKVFPAAFYRSASGTEPVRDWLRDLPTVDRRAVGFDIATAEFGWPMGMPLCRSLGDGLWEVRSNLAQGRVARVMSCAAEGRMVLLHGFVKKTQKTPQSDLQLARQRQKELSREPR
jgi:phage-related protein